MLRPLLAVLVATLLVILEAGVPARAATLGGAVNPAIGFALGGGVDISDDGTGLTIVNGVGASLAGFGPSAPGGDFDLFVFGDSLGVAGGAASLFVDGAAGSLEGALVAADVSATAVQLLFDVTLDDFALFGDRVLLVLSGDFSAGLSAAGVSAVINPVAAPAPIPLPAGLQLLATALAGAALLGRRRA